ncbi:MAG: patatin-like phospholipase family protein [Propionibacteriaceae bacterium]|jgi:NTE family protein|nr:patatin-like phospholipase family protein [Propionibacteriaceae bacterium]
MKVALVLGSGGARGYAHIGAIQVLRERGHQITAISGSSIGALIGGLEATSKLDEYTEWVLGLSQKDVLLMMDPQIGAAGAVRMERVFTKMRELYAGALIEELPIPYTAIATDLVSGREVWFQSGPLETAVRASISIPGVITPIVESGRLLVDGGVVNPVPMEPVMAADADFTLAVSLSGFDPLELGASPVRSTSFFGSLLSKLRKDDGPAEPPYQEPPSDLSIASITSRSIETMSAVITRYRMASHHPDILVTVPHTAAKSLDFHKAAELIALGRDLTEAALGAVA